jgi:hypothetical protein
MVVWLLFEIDRSWSVILREEKRHTITIRLGKTNFMPVLPVARCAVKVST